MKKGDNPVGIAKKLKVSYNDLMTLNDIDDPRKLQIGQKLLVPDAAKPKTTSAKGTDKKKKTDQISNEKSDAKTHRTPKGLRAKCLCSLMCFAKLSECARVPATLFGAAALHRQRTAS